MDAWIGLAFAVALIAAWTAGYLIGQASSRERTQRSQVRDGIAALRAVGYTQENAQTVMRESAAAGLRKAGTWDA